LPDLILIDGGKAQVNITKKVLKKLKLNIPVVGIAKGPKRKKNEFIGKIPNGFNKDLLIKVRDEAHRFALSYHRQIRKVI
jgi:excinuclease ABC subunit C